MSSDWPMSVRLLEGEESTVLSSEEVVLMNEQPMTDKGSYGWKKQDGGRDDGDTYIPTDC
jgi:hypothetical protein